MFNIGTQELLIILVMALLLFGAKRVPEVARSFGKGLHDFREAMSGLEREFKDEALGMSEKPKAPVLRPATQTQPVVPESRRAALRETQGEDAAAALESVAGLTSGATRIDESPTPPPAVPLTGPSAGPTTSEPYEDSPRREG